MDIGQYREPTLQNVGDETDKKKKLRSIYIFKNREMCENVRFWGSLIIEKWLENVCRYKKYLKDSLEYWKGWNFVCIPRKLQGWDCFRLVC